MENQGRYRASGEGALVSVAQGGRWGENLSGADVLLRDTNDGEGVLLSILHESTWPAVLYFSLVHFVWTRGLERGRI